MDNNNNNVRFMFLGALLTVVAGEAPFAPYPAAALKIVAPFAPYPPAIPAPVYGVPKIALPLRQPIATSYKYEVINPPPRPVEILAPYPAPVLRSGPYPPAIPAPVYGLPKIVLPAAQPIATSYKYEVINPPPRPVEILAPYPAPVLRSGPYPPAVPAPVYGVPRIQLPAPRPILTSYKYEVINPPPRPVEILTPYPAAVPLLKSGPYPAPALIVKSEPYPVPIVPAPIYGVPKFEIPAKPVLTSYHYKLPVPQVKLAPYPAAIPTLPIAPHSVYGLGHH